MLAMDGWVGVGMGAVAPRRCHPAAPPPPHPAELPEPPPPPRPRAALQRQTTWAGRSLRDPPAAPTLVKSGSLSFPRAEAPTLEAGVGQMLRALGAPEPPPVQDAAPASAEGSLSDVSFATDDSERADEGGAGGARRDEEGGGTPRRGLAAKLQQLLSPGRRPSARHAAERRGAPRQRNGGGGGGGSEQRDPPQRRSPMDGVLHPRERPDSTASESSVSLGSDFDFSEASPGGHKGGEAPGDAAPEPPAVEVLLSSCSRCQGCGSLVYDEEVMAGWSSDDSNLNTACPFCARPFVPFLSIEIRDFQAHRAPQDAPAEPPSGQGPVLSDRLQCLALDEGDPEPGLCNGSTEGAARGAPRRRERLALAYLSPLVLRKELESLVENEGSECLAQAALVDSHPILYWNLLWYFQRLALPSNLPRLLLGSQHMETPRQALPPDAVTVGVRLLWDVLEPEPDSAPPLYVLWRLHSNVPGRLQAWPRRAPPVSLAFLEAVLSHVGLSEVHKAIALFLDAPPAMGGPQHTQRSIYREILFLTLAALGREHTDIAAFDKKYRSAFSKLAGSLGKEELRRRRAQPPSSKAIDCRKSFGALLEC